MQRKFSFLTKMWIFYDFFALMFTKFYKWPLLQIEPSSPSLNFLLFCAFCPKKKVLRWQMWDTNSCFCFPYLNSSHCGVLTFVFAKLSSPSSLILPFSHLTFYGACQPNKSIFLGWFQLGNQKKKKNNCSFGGILFNILKYSQTLAWLFLN